MSFHAGSSSDALEYGTRGRVLHGVSPFSLKIHVLHCPARISFSGLAASRKRASSTHSEGFTGELPVAEGIALPDGQTPSPPGSMIRASSNGPETVAPKLPAFIFIAPPTVPGMA